MICWWDSLRNWLTLEFYFKCFGDLFLCLMVRSQMPSRSQERESVDRDWSVIECDYCEFRLLYSLAVTTNGEEEHLFCGELYWGNKESQLTRDIDILIVWTRVHDAWVTAIGSEFISPLTVDCGGVGLISKFREEANQLWSKNVLLSGIAWKLPF